MTRRDAIAALIDTAGTAAAWSDEAEPAGYGGATISLSLSYTAAARGSDLEADARVLRRGHALCFVAVTARSGDVAVATGQLVHRFATT